MPAKAASAGAELERLRRQAASCRACDLWKCGTQTVFGDGDPRARMMFVGEQPGDAEDRAGRPFVGPAGKLFDRALAEAGIDRASTYVTNAVKHFRWEARGKRRIHKKPNSKQIAACHPWLESEFEVVRPEIVVALGATAAQALLGPRFRLTQHRGEIVTPDGLPPITATVHPSSILRARDDDGRHREFDLFVQDLRTAAQGLKRQRRAG
jgi:uracil-DNA glycosylase